MTTGINPDVNPAARRWAAKILAVEENASREEIKRAYLRKLRVDDFLPPHSLHHALGILNGKKAPAHVNEEWLREEEGRLRADVESFAEEFFTLLVSQRRQRWEALLARCPDVSPLTARLQALKAGLEVETQSLPSDSSFHGQLAEQIVQSFPLAPLAQVTSRQAFLRQIEESSDLDQPLWEKAARYLQAEWPALAALDPKLVQDIAKLRSRLRRRSKMHRRSQPQPAATPAASGTGVPWWVLVIVGGVLSAVLRGFTNSNDSPSPKVPSPQFSVPHDSIGLPRFDNLPPIQELIDPSKFDVETVDPPGARIFRFTPRPGSTITGPNDPKANKGQPLMYGEAALRLLGVSGEQVKDLYSRAAKAKRTDILPKMPQQEVVPKSSQADKPTP